MSAPRPLSVLLVDDSLVVRARLRELLAADPHVQVVGVAGTGAEALLHFQFLVPDLVVLDIGLPDTSGLTLLTAFKNQRPSCIVVMLTGNAECRERALSLGADHFCEKAMEFERAAQLVSEIAAFHAACLQAKPANPPSEDRARE